jgi:hypothetical protein
MRCLLCQQPEAADIHDETSPKFHHDPAMPRAGVCRVCGDPREVGFDLQHVAGVSFDHDYDPVPPPVQLGGGDASSLPRPESVNPISGDSLEGAIPDQSTCGVVGCTKPRWRHVDYVHEWIPNVVPPSN